MTPKKLPDENVPITVDPRTVKAVEESRYRATLKAIRIMALGAVISWGMLAYIWGRDEGPAPWTFPVVIAGVYIALYGRRVFERGRGELLGELRTATQQPVERDD